MQHKLRDYFRTHRKRHGLGQQQMAKLLGKNRCYVSQLERGKCIPSLETVLSYHILFDVEITELIPEFYQDLHTLLEHRLHDSAYLFSDKHSVITIKRRLKMSTVVGTNNKQAYDS